MYAKNVPYFLKHDILCNRITIKLKWLSLTLNNVDKNENDSTT